LSAEVFEKTNDNENACEDVKPCKSAALFVAVIACVIFKALVIDKDIVLSIPGVSSICREREKRREAVGLCDDDQAKVSQIELVSGKK
jgi:hypothetical protein